MVLPPGNDRKRERKVKEGPSLSGVWMVGGWVSRGEEEEEERWTKKGKKERKV